MAIEMSRFLTRDSWTRAGEISGCLTTVTPRSSCPRTASQSWGVLYWKLDPSDYENDEELRKIRVDMGYSYLDLLDLCPEKVDNYEQKLKNFYTKHIHGNEEICYCLEGSGYFDVRDKEVRWIRIWMKPGDLIILPAWIYHRFTLDIDNYVKLMRLFVGEPVWTAYNPPQEDHLARKEYLKCLTEKVGPGLALIAH